jgi:hypothetical protein
MDLGRCVEVAAGCVTGGCAKAADCMTVKAASDATAFATVAKNRRILAAGRYAEFPNPLRGVMEARDWLRSPCSMNA